MGRRLSCRFAAILVATSVVRLLGQGPTDQKAMAFEVASIKPNTSDAVGVGGLGWGADSIRGRNQSPASLLRMGVWRSGGPDHPHASMGVRRTL
jgi:hypothetical protein